MSSLYIIICDRCHKRTEHASPSGLVNNKVFIEFENAPSQRLDLCDMCALSLSAWTNRNEQ